MIAENAEILNYTVNSGPPALSGIEETSSIVFLVTHKAKANKEM